MEAAELERLGDHEESYWWHRVRELIVHQLLRRYAPPNPRILDIGCGTGATTASLRCFGPVVAMDIASQALARARTRRLPVIRSSAQHLPVRPGCFDLVVALDVFEHLDDDLAAAREVRAALAPGGVLVATVPAYAFLWSSHDVSLGHRRRYRRGQLIDLLSRADLEVERCTYVMSSIVPVAIAVRLAERLLPQGRRPARSGYVPTPDLLNRLLVRLVGIDRYLLRWLDLPFGLSVAAVARRPLSDSASGSDTAGPARARPGGRCAA